MKFYRVPRSLYVGPYKNIPLRIGAHILLSMAVALGIVLLQGHYRLDWYMKVFCLSIANDLVMSVGHIWIFYNLDQNYDWIKKTWARFASGVLFHTVFSVIAFFIIQIILFQVLFGMSMGDSIYWFGVYWWLPVVITTAVIFFTTTIGFFKNWKKSLVEEERMKAEMMAYKFESLKSQINPSFLFESFEALKALIDQDTAGSVALIQKISRLYRQVLENKDVELVPLGDELKLLGLYRDILGLRFGESLKMELEVPEEAADIVVPMALLTMVELLLPTQSSDPLTLRITRNEQMVRIHSPAKRSVDPGIIDNLNRRYGFFTEMEVIIKMNEYETTIEVPILTHEP